MGYVLGVLLIGRLVIKLRCRWVGWLWSSVLADGGPSLNDIHRASVPNRERIKRRPILHGWINEYERVA
jgi:hypothetical protein